MGVSGVTFLVVQWKRRALPSGKTPHQERGAAAPGHWLCQSPWSWPSATAPFRLEQVTQEQSQAQSLRIAVMEPEIGIFEEQRTQFPPYENPVQILRWNLLRHQLDTARLLQAKSDLVLWPESSYFPVISLLAHRGEPDVLAFSGKQVIGAEMSGSLRTPLEASGEVAVAVSAGEDRTWFAGQGGQIWRMVDQKPALLDPAVAKEDFLAGALSCRADEGMDGTAVSDLHPRVCGEKRHGPLSSEGTASSYSPATPSEICCRPPHRRLDWSWQAVKK